MLTLDEYLRLPLGHERELKLLFSYKRPKYIMDVGSCTGEDAIRYSNMFPRSTIIAFEPLQENLKIMHTHFTNYYKTKIKVELLALSDENGEARFYVSGGNPHHESEQEITSIMPKEWNKSSSLLPPTDLSYKYLPWLKFENEVTVKTMRLDDYIQQNKISTIDFMHIDVQGAELKVLRGMGKRISDLGAAWVEVGNEALYKDQPLKNEIDLFFKQNNFIKIKDTSMGKISGDCLYINKTRMGIPMRLLFFLLKLKRLFL